MITRNETANMKQLALFADIPVYEAPLFSAEHIQSIIENNDDIARGTECKVYAITDKVLFKHYYYNTPEQIATIFENAKIAANCGIAPAVYQLFDNGYTTEKVRILDFHRCYERCDGRDYCGDSSCTKNILDDNGIDIDDFNELCENANSLGISGDEHLQNIGKTENGQLVWIDFGTSSYSY